LSHLHVAEAVPLGYALVARVASDAGVRALCIKGPRSVENGWREPHQSQDVDLLVSPNQFEEMSNHLVRLGWTDATVHEANYIALPHSRQFRHPSWPFELDLHRYFPGFFADKQFVFDSLWTNRVPVNSAGMIVWGPAPEAAQLVEWLHALREPKLKRRQLRFLRSTWPLIDRSSIAELAQRLGAAEALEPDWRINSTVPIDRSELVAWRLRAEVSHTPAINFVYRWREANWRGRMRLLSKTSRSTTAEIESARRDNKGRLAVARARLTRAWSRLRALRAASDRLKLAEERARR